MVNKSAITLANVQHTALLANLSLSENRLSQFQHQLESIIEFVKTVQTVNTADVAATTQVTGLTNVMREDVVDDSRTFSQKEALQNAQSIHNGYFMIPAILE